MQEQFNLQKGRTMLSDNKEEENILYYSEIWTKFSLNAKWTFLGSWFQNLIASLTINYNSDWVQMPVTFLEC